jgi:hypothetical protein
MKQGRGRGQRKRVDAGATIEAADAAEHASNN